MSLPDPFNDSLSFRAGQQHMQRRISELLRQRRTLIQSLPARSSVVRALGTELDVIIRAVDALTIDGQA